jgi:hypothetical protein
MLVRHAIGFFGCLLTSALLPALLATGCSSPAEPASSSQASISAPDPGSFTLPPSDPQQRAAILANYEYVDPQNVVPRGLLEDALEYYDINKALLPNQSHIAVVDFSQFSGHYRFFLVDMTTGAVERHKVAHGSGSDPNATGYATRFSNTSGSHMSSLGFYMAADIYDGTHPNSMHIYGLSADGSPNSMANTNVLSRAVVVHPATYVSDGNSGAQGRSDGCFALDPGITLSVDEKLTNGGLLYAEKTPLNAPVGRVSDGGTGDGGTGDGGTMDSGGDAPAGDCQLAGNNYATNTCTETQQCDSGSWVSRNSDPANCDTGVLPNGACVTDTGSVVPENTCTSTLQCDNGVWVSRYSDPSACL